ncbi:hypothetical protein HN51_036835 [Arachis hypogaea]
MGKNKLIPSDFDDDHIFYLYVDLVAVTHELPSLFYRKYNHLLHDRMIVIDANDNQIELSLGRGFSAGYIINGFHNLVACYGLTHGGWMKLLYVEEDIFVVMKLKDSCMTTKEFSCPPSISLTAIKSQGPLNNSQQRTIDLLPPLLLIQIVMI